MGNEQAMKLLEVQTSDAKIQVPMRILYKFGVVRQLFENCTGSDENTVPLPGIDSQTMHLILKWDDKPEILANTFTWDEFVKLILETKYLDCTELTEFIVMDIIPKFIHCTSQDTRSALSFEPVTIVYDDDNWERDPFAELDDSNYILDGFPIEIVLKMFKNISVKHKAILLNTFSLHHRFFKPLEIEYNNALYNNLYYRYHNIE